MIFHQNFHEALKALLEAENWRCELVKGGKAILCIYLKKLDPEDGEGWWVVCNYTSTVFLPTAALLDQYSWVGD